MQDFIKINKDDNVAVALKPIAKGTTVNVAGTEVTTVEDIPQGHKFVIKEIKNGDPVIKYGFRIGFAQADIPVGAWVHTHNLKTGLGELLEYTYEPEGHKDVEPTEPAYFDGYMRENGKVGVRNEVWIVPTVGCVNSIARAIEATARMNKPEGVDEVVAFTHPYGCSQTTEDQENTRKILADLINHPNAGAVLVLGLGCENSRIEVLKDYIGEVNSDRVKFLQVQDVENEQETAEKMMEELKPQAVKRIETRLVLEAVAKAENIEISDEKLDEEIAKMAEAYKMEADKLKEFMGENEKKQMKEDIAIQEAVTLIANAAVEG